MGDDEIKIVLGAEDMTAAAVASAKKNVGDLATSTGKASETARLGFWGMGEAAENAAQSMGVPNQMSRQLGNSVEGLASKMGKGALAFGLMGFAAMGLYGIYSELADRKKKVTEETIKGGIAAGTWIEGALKEQGATKELTQAKRQLAQAEFDLNKQRAEAALPAMVQQLTDLTNKYNDLREVAGGGKTPLFMTVENGENVFEAAERKAKKLKLEINQLAAQIGVARAQTNLFSDANRDLVGTLGVKRIDPMMSSLDDQVAEFKRTEGLARTQAEVLVQIELDKQNAIQGLRQMGLDNEYAAAMQEKAMFDGRLQAAQMLTSGLAQSFQMMYQIGGHHARQYFMLYKAAAISEAIIATYKSAADSYAFGAKFGGPALGGALAAVAVAAGMARVAAIKAQNFGSGTGAVGTYSASPSTGLPTTGGSSGSGGTIIINVNGQKVGEYELASKVARTFYNNNGSVDGYTVSVERSA